MLGGLVFFCLLCAGVFVSARWVVFESPTQLTVTLRVSKGTVGLAEPDSDEKAVRGVASVGSGDTLRTDNISQGYLAFSDPYSGEMIATVMLRTDSAATLRAGSRPRFSLSANPYAIRLTEVTGRVEVWVNAGLERDIRLEIKSPLGTTHIEGAGNFLIDSSPAALTVVARAGNAILIGAGGAAQHLAMTTQGMIRRGDPAITVGPGPIDLLPNSTFGQNKEWANEWICGHFPDAGFPNAPGANINYPTIDGRSTIHFERLTPNPGPAKTGCFQTFGETTQGLDVREYAALRLRVTMRAHYQSLSACGDKGSECPAMLHMTYTDQDGNPREWYHGFYAQYTPNLGLRTCDSCREEHEWINKDAWYTYESGDLFTELPADLRPGWINELEFYASGHEYDAVFSEVALVATRSGGAPETATAP